MHNHHDDNMIDEIFLRNIEMPDDEWPVDCGADTVTISKHKTSFIAPEQSFRNEVCILLMGLLIVTILAGAEFNHLIF